MLEHDDNNKYYNLKRQKNRGHTALNHSNSTIPLGVTDSLLLTSQAPVSQVKRCSLIRPLFCLTGVALKSIFLRCFWLLWSPFCSIMLLAILWQEHKHIKTYQLSHFLKTPFLLQEFRSMKSFYILNSFSLDWKHFCQNVSSQNFMGFLLTWFQ